VAFASLNRADTGEAQKTSGLQGRDFQAAGLRRKMGCKNSLAVLKDELRICRARDALEETALNFDNLLGIRAIHDNLFGGGFARLRQFSFAGLAKNRLFE
jgi:hypothetical protein